MLKWNIQEKKKRKIAWYLGGLNTKIYHLVQLRQYSSLDDVAHLEIRVEKQLSEKIFIPASFLQYIPYQLSQNTNPQTCFLIQIPT